LHRNYAGLLEPGQFMPAILVAQQLPAALGLTMSALLAEVEEESHGRPRRSLEFQVIQTTSHYYRLNARAPVPQNNSHPLFIGFGRRPPDNVALQRKLPAPARAEVAS
jgi:hypothetical protein